jgi:enoyl-CoA hydratase/carnithine racemase
VGGLCRLLTFACCAQNLYLTGRAVEATEAKSLHLFDEIHDDPLPRATELASHLVKTAAPVLGPMRCALELAIFPDFHAQLDKDDRIFAEWKQQLATEAKL